MSEFVAIHMPQSGPNDTTAVLIAWSKPDGEWVNKDEVIAEAETTKTVFEIAAPAAGYLTSLCEAGEEVEISAVIAVQSEARTTVEQARQWLAEKEKEKDQGIPQTEEKGWTIKAALLATQVGIDVAQVPSTGGRITEADVRAYQASKQRQQPSPVAAEEVVDLVDGRYARGKQQRLLIVGGGNGAVQVLDVLQKCAHQRAVGVMDDDPAIHGKQIAGVPIIGAIDVARAAKMLASGEIDAAIISISRNIALRARIFAEWQAAGLPFANVVHPSTVIGMNAVLGNGNVLMAFCHIGPCATMGDNNFLSAYCSVEHHSVVGDHCSFGPAVVTSSSVRIEDRVRMGTGIYLEPRVEIGADSVIASGLAITQNIPERSLLKAKVGYTARQR